LVLHLWIRDRGPWQTALALNCERLVQLRTRDRVPPPHDLLQDPHGDQDDQTPATDNNQNLKKKLFRQRLPHKRVKAHVTMPFRIMGRNGLTLAD